MAGARVDDPAGIVAAVQDSRAGYAIVDLTKGEVETLRQLQTAAATFFTQEAVVKDRGKGTSKFGYKRSALKERVQFRLPGCPRGAVAHGLVSDVTSEQATAVAPRSKADFGAFQPGLVEGAVLLRRLATRALLALLRGTGLDADAVLEECVAESPTAASTSVLNVYNYFNRGDSGKSEANDGQPISANCPAHTDPGLVTVLARGTADGLQIATGRTSDAACCSGTAAYHVDGVDGESVAPDDVEWVTMEPLMRADQVGVLVGESLRRLTGGALPACLHRVVSNGSHCERSNVIYELRPAGNVFHPWENGAHDKVSAASKAPS